MHREGEKSRKKILVRKKGRFMWINLSFKETQWDWVQMAQYQ
jgi:hypothetical protein